MRAVARPGPVRRRQHQARGHRVALDIAAQRQQIGVAVDKDGLEAALEHNSHQSMAAVEASQVDPVELAHNQRQIRLARVQHQVVVVAHQAVGQNLGVKAVHGLGQDAQEGFAVFVVLEDRTAPIAPCRDVVQRAGELNAQGAGHGGVWGDLWQKARPDPDALVAKGKT